MNLNFSKVLSVGAAVLFLALVVFQGIRGFTTQTTVLSVVIVILAFYKDSEFTRDERKKMQKELADTKSALEDKIVKLSEELDAKNTQLKDRIEYVNSQVSSMKISSGIKSRGM